MTSEDDFVAIIGLGLIGGSLARDLAARGERVRAYDVDRVALRRAMDEGIVECGLDEDLAGVRDASTIVVAVPVDATAGVLERIAPVLGPETLITDAGSTKARIVAQAARIGLADQFVGAHPLAGDHRSGWDASRDGLFCGARVYLCPLAETSAALVDRAARFWSSFGAKPVLLRADLHDAKLAYTSHLPQFASVALALALAGRGVKRDELGPGGRDITRLAGSSPEMWAAIARDNAPALDEALRLAERELAELRSALSGTTDGSPSDGALYERLVAARAWFDQ